MKKKGIAQIGVLLLILLLGVGTFFVLLFSSKNKKVEMVQKKEEITLLSSMTTCEAFQEVPVWEAEGVKMGEAVEYGSDVYIIDLLLL